MMRRYPLILILILGLFLVFGCEDDEGTDDDVIETDAWVGTWLSAGTDVAPLLAALFSLDSIEATFNEDNTVSLRQHEVGAAWTSLNGTYLITESTDSEIDAITLDYTTFTQEGIIEIIDGVLRLEAVQTVPDIGATVPTVAAGFGADPTLGIVNIQTYRIQD